MAPKGDQPKAEHILQAVIVADAAEVRFRPMTLTKPRVCPGLSCPQPSPRNFPPSLPSINRSLTHSCSYLIVL